MTRRSPWALDSPSKDDRHLARRPFHAEADVRALDVGTRQLGRLQAFHFLAPRRRLAGARAGAEAGDEVVQLRDLLLALRVLGFDPGANLRLRQDHVVVPAGVGDDRLVVDVCDVGADLVEEVPIVGDHDERTLIADQELLEPVNGVEVEVIRRLVQQQRLGVAEERLRQQDSHLLAALQLGHGPFVKRIRNVEPLEQRGGVALGRVAVFLPDDSLELAQSHAVLVRQLGLRVEPVAFGERAPEPLVAHDHRVDDAVGVEGILILAQHAELSGPAHGPALRLQLSREQLHERGFSGPVGPAQPVAAPRREGGGDLLEEHLRAVPHRHTACRNHRRAFIFGVSPWSEPLILSGLLP